MLHNALSVVKKCQKLSRSPCHFVTLSEKDRATAIRNRQKKIVKDRACGSEYMFADRQTDTQTDRHTHTCSLQYFAKEQTDLLCDAPSVY